jgi:hypothetical protein
MAYFKLILQHSLQGTNMNKTSNIYQADNGLNPSQRLLEYQAEAVIIDVISPTRKERRNTMHIVTITVIMLC